MDIDDMFKQLGGFRRVMDIDIDDMFKQLFGFKEVLDKLWHKLETYEKELVMEVGWQIEYYDNIVDGWRLWNPELYFNINVNCLSNIRMRPKRMRVFESCESVLDKISTIE